MNIFYNNLKSYLLKKLNLKNLIIKGPSNFHDCNSIIECLLQCRYKSRLWEKLPYDVYERICMNVIDNGQVECNMNNISHFQIKNNCYQLITKKMINSYLNKSFFVPIINMLIRLIECRNEF